MDSDGICTPRAITYKDLERYTDGFSQDRFIGRTQFGEVYRGKIQQSSNGMEAQEVTVKIWTKSTRYYIYDMDNFCRLDDEIYLQKHPKWNSLPNLVRVIEYCREDDEHLGVIYDLKSLDTVHNLILKDNFTWLMRIKVAIGFAKTLESLNAENPPMLPYLLRNVDAAHIIVDQDYNPKLISFDMITGGILPDRRNLPQQYVHGCYGYIDTYYNRLGEWPDKCDVFGFGVVLLGLICKRVNEQYEECTSEAPTLHEWAKAEYRPKRSIFSCGSVKDSLVHQSLKEEPVFCNVDGRKITKLAMQCIEHWPDERPTVAQVVKKLMNLCVVKSFGHIIGIHDQMLGKGCI